MEYNEMHWANYSILDKQRAKLKNDLITIQRELLNTEAMFNFYESIFKPKYRIAEINNNKMGRRFTGKVKILGRDGLKSDFVSFSIGRYDKYNGIDDPNLDKDALQKAQEKIREFYPEYFK